MSLECEPWVFSGVFVGELRETTIKLFIQSYCHASGRDSIVFTGCKEVLLSAAFPLVLRFIIRDGYYLQEDDCFAAHEHQQL